MFLAIIVWNVLWTPASMVSSQLGTEDAGQLIVSDIIDVLPPRYGCGAGRPRVRRMCAAREPPIRRQSTPRFSRYGVAGHNMYPIVSQIIG